MLGSYAAQLRHVLNAEVRQNIDMCLKNTNEWSDLISKLDQTKHLNVGTNLHLQRNHKRN